MAEETQGKTRGAKNFRGKGVRVLGLSLQDVIKYFFGGNASLAIISLLLICVFLVREAYLFLPTYSKELAVFRKTGLEFVDTIREETAAHKGVYSLLNQAYLAEINESSKDEFRILLAYQQVGLAVEKATKRLAGDLKKAGASADAALRDRWLVAAGEALGQEKIWEVQVDGFGWTNEIKEKVREAVLEAVPGSGVKPAYVAELEERKSRLVAEATEKWKAFGETRAAFRKAGSDLEDLGRDLAKTAKANREQADAFASAPERRSALLEGAKKEADPARKARSIAEAEAIVVAEPDYATLVKPFYENVAKHTEVNAALRAEIGKIVAQLPEEKEMVSAVGLDNLQLGRRAAGQFVEMLEEGVGTLESWRHDKPVSLLSGVTSFFFGKRWISNSSWQDFYGVLPLFTGSLIIALIAMSIAVPISIMAAIYVNQLAAFREQSLVKPIIEFIGAIPSVVLGFFGIMVLGTTLREVSQVEWLAWIPGFPMQERLTMLNAGLLLAFMSIPTIFTLAEDALNNVPMAFTENSLALGATKLQTVFRVVLPTAVSGIIAAVLLGFGRIIGETMVVLLVAGNKIQIPDFNAGLGVVAQPAHTMTGIIAQELGEVEQGSLHWQALFMVGMVLFVISLVVNYAAQAIVKRFRKI